MNAATEFDLGPLTWVKGEIDLALQRAEQALDEYVASADRTQLKFCRTHVHQVHGALAMVGLEGVTLLTDSTESLLAGMEEDRLPSGDAAVTVLRQTLHALRQYLDDLMAGEPNHPLVLLPVYQALEAARGLPGAHPCDLFYPDLSRRPPKRDGEVPVLDAEQLLRTLKVKRMQFQKGLLRLLRDPADAEPGRRMMREAIAAIEAVQPTPAARSFWWISLGVLDALADPVLGADPSSRQLCSRIDAQIRRLVGGSSNVAERVLRESLYYIAQAPADLSPGIAEIQSVFSLPDLLPSPADQVAQLPYHGELRKLREALAAVEELWGRFCTGNTGSLPGFADNARTCAQLTEQIGQTDLKRLGQGLGAIANWLSEDSSRFNDGVAMEVATTILLLENAQENFRRLGTDFAQQVDLMVARLYACIAGRPAADDEGIPLLDEMTRRAQEKLLIGQVGREIQNNLAQIEQALDGFFRDPAKAHDLAQLDNPIKQISGALAMLGHFGAVNYLKECAARIRQFAQPDYQPMSEDFEAVADELSMLGFFVDSLQNGETDFDAFVRRMAGGASDEAAPEYDESPAAPTVEALLSQQARDMQALADALKEAPQDARLHDELKQNLQDIQKDADLVANRELGESAKAALAALQSGVEVDAALSGLKPQAPDAPAPSAETLQLAESSHEEIDAELLAIFLEEANEVLATIDEQKAVLAATPDNVEALTTVRRSMHTLKGSGRMVGLKDLGEAAWELEQTLNLWLRQDTAVTPDLQRMIDDAHVLFSDWVLHLESAQGAAPDPSALVALAARLRGVEVPVVAMPAPVVDSAPLAVEPVEQPPIESPEEASEPLEESIEALPAVEEIADFAIELPELESGPEISVEPELAPEVIDLPALPGDEEAFAEPEQLEEQPEEPVLRSTPENEQISNAPEAPPEPASEAPTLYDIFREEARGHLQTLVDSYAVIDADPSAPTTFEMTRAAHTLGGIAATVGIMPLHRLAVALEHTLLRRDASGQAESIEGIETVRQAIITLEDMFAGLAQQRSPDEQVQLIAALEDVFHAPLPADEPAPVGAEIIELPGRPADALETAVEAVTIAPAPALPLLNDELDEQLLPIFLEEAVDLTRDLTSQVRAWRGDPAGDAAPHAIARLLHTFKGSARMAGAMNLGEATHQLEARLEEAVRAGHVTPAFIDEIESGCDVLDQAVERLRAGPQEPVVAETAEGPADVAQPASPSPTTAEAEESDSEAGGQRATLRVRADLIDRLVSEAGELSIARTRIEGEMRSLKGSLLELTENVIRLRRQLREIEIQAESQIQARVAQTPENEADFDPLELDRFTRFQELTRFMAESVNDVATVQQSLLKNLDDANAAILAQSRLNRSLQQELMGVRMVPFNSQTERLYRIVRQTAKEVGKRANLDIVGGQVDIDRSVLDKMLAPIEHMLRNAVTHGVESRDERLAAGKNEAGEIVIKLSQEGNEIILAMSDDGKGLDGDRIRARAEAMGLLQPGQAADEAKLFDFIFQPGFSTAAEVTQLSGRGVGMDVVKTEVGEIGGRIEIQSQPGQGSTFRLYLPLTLAVTQTLLVRVGSHLYAVPSTMIEQVKEMKEKALAAVREKGEVEWQGNRYPFHFLPHLLGDLEAVPEAHRQYWVLLLRSGSQRVGVLVDELRGNQEVVVKNIGAQLARVVGIAGATVLGDGKVVLILNPVALASRTTVSHAHAAVPAMLAPVIAEAVSLPTVMVVDDSLTVRKITSRLLMREGYQVILAKDGVDALEQLVEVTPDVILSDIEMPRMDGFDLVRNLRADARLSRLPVIMITSRTADKHRNYALEIGANHYLGKPYDEAELLGLVAGYCKK
ncbi:MAG: Hpt domain-containing protein [Gammaproteobacteria bacterium]|nr:Hpt domain-containing protein [Gammaproteobacteria bacterium]MBU1602271.1 Hpt domain-containing protein [Gammaproteobacteria bacterium]MBU2433076.1 Hpt domain-containing protein [Gammaproteobacteria bacterium]MBU2450990.1 Hpt domain-containing protein [Gammaproteobacteria bacterium]